MTPVCIDSVNNRPGLELMRSYLEYKRTSLRALSLSWLTLSRAARRSCSSSYSTTLQHRIRITANVSKQQQTAWSGHQIGCIASHRNGHGWYQLCPIFQSSLCQLQTLQKQVLIADCSDTASDITSAPTFGLQRAEKEYKMQQLMDSVFVCCSPNYGTKVC